MNISLVKENLKKLLGKKVIVKEYIGRNKHETYLALVYKMYPNLFVLKIDDVIKSFSYSDLLIKNVVLKEKHK